MSAPFASRLPKRPVPAGGVPIGSAVRAVARPSVLLLALAGLATLLAVACGNGGDQGSGGSGGAGGKITVFAAASLTDAFNEIKTAFASKNPGSKVEMQFAGSSTLRAQLEQGARADVYASADVPNMQQALKAGVVADEGHVFARNSLVIITPKDNPARVNSPLDLRKPGLKLVLAAPEVPVGSYARQSLALMDRDPAYGSGFSAAVLKNVVSNESNVKQVVAKVQLGEADAGVVYGTDVTTDVEGDLTRVAIPPDLNVVAEYPIAVTRSAANRSLADAFVAFVLGREGQGILQRYGFQPLTQAR